MSRIFKRPKNSFGGFAVPLAKTEEEHQSRRTRWNALSQAGRKRGWFGNQRGKKNKLETGGGKQFWEMGRTAFTGVRGQGRGGCAPRHKPRRKKSLGTKTANITFDRRGTPVAEEEEGGGGAASWGKTAQTDSASM